LLITVARQSKSGPKMQKAADACVAWFEKLSANASLKVFGRVVPGKVVVASGVAATTAAAASFLYLGLRKAPLPLVLLQQKRNLHYLCHPMDLYALGQFLFTSKLPEVPKDLDADWTWCYQKLVKTSRSFAAVILELNEELRGAVALFYLVLRALDTIGTSPHWWSARKFGCCLFCSLHMPTIALHP